VLICQQLLFHYIYDVQLGAAAVEIVVFKRLVIFSIPYGDIVRVERCASHLQLRARFDKSAVRRIFSPSAHTRPLSANFGDAKRGSDEFYNALMMQLGHLPIEKSRR
jgi:hypothetical protein